MVIQHHTSAFPRSPNESSEQCHRLAAHKHGETYAALESPFPPRFACLFHSHEDAATFVDR